MSNQIQSWYFVYQWTADLNSLKNISIAPNTSNSCIIFTLKMESVYKITIFGLKMMEQK